MYDGKSGGHPQTGSEKALSSLTVTPLEEDQTRVNVLPKKLADGENAALTTPNEFHRNRRRTRRTTAGRNC
jgi:hypothetical protein